MPELSLVLRLAAPLQSWGTASRFTRRDTALQPTKSGVVGMCAAALGRSRTADVADLAALWMGVRVDHPGVVRYDYQTILGVPDTEGKGADTVVSERWFLSDAVFLVVLAGDRALLERLADAIRRPVFPLALGRKSYVPTQPIVLALEEVEREAILRTHPWLVTAQRLRRPIVRAVEEGREVKLRSVRDCAPQDASAWYPDHPLAFEPRRFLRRPVRIEEVSLRSDMLREEVLTWRST